MKIEQLEYITEVAKSGSLSLAARKLYITQSAISQSITSLEAELGVKIFRRSRIGTTPTDTGKKIIKKALETLEKLDELKMETDLNLNLVDGNLRIGTIPSPLMYLPKTIAAFKKDYPNIRIEISEESSQDIVDHIKRDELDIGLIGLSMEGKELKDENIAFKILLRGKMIVAASIDSPLAFADAVTPEEVRKYPIVIYNDDRMWEFVNYLSAQFGQLDVLFSTNNLDAIRNAVMENLAITIAPDYTVLSDPNLLTGKGVPVEVAGFEQDYQGMALVWSKTKYNTTIIRNFTSRLLSDMSRLKNQL
ncbi:LysR family transcriptional regulator [Virgibacillus natechei]